MTNQKMYVAGNRGVVSFAIVLLPQGIQKTVWLSTHAELDLTNQLAKQQFIHKKNADRYNYLLPNLRY